MCSWTVYSCFSFDLKFSHFFPYFFVMSTIVFSQLPNVVLYFPLSFFGATQFSESAKCYEWKHLQGFHGDVYWERTLVWVSDIVLNTTTNHNILQGVRGQSGFFNWALRERNIQVRLYLKVVLKSWDVDILIIRTNFYKSNIVWPQQPPTEKVLKFNMLFHDSSNFFFF